MFLEIFIPAHKTNHSLVQTSTRFHQIPPLRGSNRSVQVLSMRATRTRFEIGTYAWPSLGEHAGNPLTARCRELLPRVTWAQSNFEPKRPVHRFHSLARSVHDVCTLVCRAKGQHFGIFGRLKTRNSSFVYRHHFFVAISVKRQPWYRNEPWVQLNVFFFWNFWVIRSLNGGWKGELMLLWW